ncbi:hypothetical protein [Amycolatopsis magusensis]|uniref:hypothetical protein n=1 Tax=Amycolatopsis magusensis TaxID=882444 RepID=UPI003C2B8A39
MADLVTGIVRVPYAQLSYLGGDLDIPAGARVVIDLAGFYDLPRIGETLRDRGRMDFLDYRDKAGLRRIAAAAGAVEVVGEAAEVAPMVSLLRAYVEEAGRVA